ncbi:hypothetical protein A9P82_08480 [Arachidicoccus ginsenosidimutans]|uniref:tyrosine-type recombinase/integrase n=1 Tax=Arachidicoccus sp. BS20 TaxID=1850526 RepID=UPI0007F12ECD|nr:tyrosine-type recombinase/integrase [Arachidicoccus sp. BS20]ANI89311.1 hypothetical protein A9P82_08410 [Arachidicoccus sp. BS20]ANI89324.1 hypothetical protein A9P82_08480 [Arachidicoccus sp. BS20]
MEKFKEWLRIKGYGSNTIDTIVRVTEYFFAWAEKENLSDITETTHNDIIAYVQHYRLKGTGSKTIAHYVWQLKKYFEWLMSEGEVSDNPCSNIVIKGIKRKVLYEILSEEALNALYENYRTDIVLEKTETLKSPPPQVLQQLARKRNKAVLGLLVYQGLSTEDIIRLQLQDLRLREGKVFIAGTKRSNERTLPLESRQVFDLLDYINDTRKQILQRRNITEPVQDLFLNIGESPRKNNLFEMLVKHLKQMNGKVKNIDQIRASVIVHWLQRYNLRKVQVMAGHRYISSTEQYQANNLEDLKEDIKHYHPF